MAQSTSFNFKPLTKFFPVKQLTMTTANNLQLLGLEDNGRTRRQETIYTERVDRKNPTLRRKNSQHR